MHHEFNKGALFGLEDGRGKSAAKRQEETSEDVELLALAEEDVAGEDVDLEASAIIDDDGEVCECLVVD